ncbi:VOC family protein [Mycobacterium sp. 48b]|uniref:VOC family protein n=1 Tax=Mycobacterium sp. 48b TaxID=3400426 RepID=UPI003AB048AF
MATIEELDALGVLAATLGADARVFHVGFVVPDLDSAIKDVGQTLGLTFTEPVEVAGLTLHTSAGERDDVVLRFTYSTRPTHVELIEHTAAPETLWDFGSRTRGHHIGVFSEDVAIEAERLDACGWNRSWWATAPDGTMVFSMHDTPYGFAVELVSSAGKQYFAGQFIEADESLKEK